MSDPLPRSLSALSKAESLCTRCPLYKNATRVVPGTGPEDATLMLVGEQPGNDEDLAGVPFVGPAGQMLDRALAEAGLDRQKIFVTNAVKHFKFEPRGKRRLHKKPNSQEIEACKWWNDIERALVKPQLVVALGATAARSLMGKPVTIAKLRGQILAMPDGGRILITVHPSSLLRIRDSADKKEQFAALVRDLKLCAKLPRAPVAA